MSFNPRAIRQKQVKAPLNKYPTKRGYPNNLNEKGLNFGRRVIIDNAEGRKENRPILYKPALYNNNNNGRYPFETTEDKTNRALPLLYDDLIEKRRKDKEEQEKQRENEIREKAEENLKNRQKAIELKDEEKHNEDEEYDEKTKIIKYIN